MADSVPLSRFTSSAWRGGVLSECRREFMKPGRLIFHLAVATIMMALSLVPRGDAVGGHILLSRSEFWHLGFGPIVVASAILLAVASLAAYRGSVWGARFCKLWLGLFGAAYTILLVSHFSQGWWSWSLGALIPASVAWYFTTPGRRTENVVKPPTKALTD